MTRITLSRLSGLLTMFTALTLGGNATAQVSIIPSVSFSNGLYTYNYSVTNTTNNTLALTTFNVLPIPNAVTLTPANFPAGFQETFDSGLGLVSFLEDADPATPQSFAPGTTVSGFTFTSPFQPATSPFEALDINGNSFTGNTLAPASVPEPGSVALGLLTGATTLLLRARRRGLAARG